MENMQEKLYSGSPDNKKGRWNWLMLGILVSLIAASIFTSFYGAFRSLVENYNKVALEGDQNVNWLYQNTYILYRDLYNVKNQCHESYMNIYLQEDSLSQWFLSQGTEISVQDQDRSDFQTESSEEKTVHGDESVLEISHELGERLDALAEIFLRIEDSYSVLNNAYGYVIQDHQTDCYVTNMSEEELVNLSIDSHFLLSFIFDSAGNVSVGEEIIADDPVSLRRTAGNAVKEIMQLNAAYEGLISGPVDCTVTYTVPQKTWRKNSDAFSYLLLDDRYTFEGHYSFSYLMVGYHSNVEYWNYEQYSGAPACLIFLTVFVFGLGIFLPVRTFRPWSERKICSLPVEGLALIGFLLLICYEPCMELVAFVAGGRANIVLEEYLSSYMGSILRDPVIIVGNVSVFTMLFLCVWFLGISVRPVREEGLWKYLRKRSLVWRLGGYIKNHVKSTIRSVYHYFLHVDLTKDSIKAIRRLVLFNALILAVISVTWLGGLGIVVVYSLVLYLILKKYISNLQKRYSILLKAVDEMAEGNLNVTIEEDLGVFEPFKPQIIKIQNGFKKAVDEEVRSQHMKTELITNVSHDLKTPLTAIITYVNLLKNPDLTEEQRREYLDTLERKSLRLKVLIEDLFEISKANSRNVTLNLMPVDIMSLIKQVALEMKDKLDEAQLDIRMNLTDEKVIISLDSQKTYRIYENLFSNVAKYALHGTRVYVNGFRIDDTVVITVKNISELELTVDPSELTERFVRGDAARNTEGSGLGLAIAKSFAELQGGSLEVEVDGDLFKVTTIWHV